MSDTFWIRQATAADASELARLNAAFNDSDEPPAALAKRLADPQRTELALLAEMAGRAVGFAGLRISPGLFYPEPRAELTELYVEPASRRQGIGRALVDHAEQLAAEAGATELFVLTGFENDVAQALYRESGFSDAELALRKAI